MAIKIEEVNKRALVEALEAAAGKATTSTIRDWGGLERALQFVELDLERRFPVPETVTFRALFTSGGNWADVTKLTFLRTSGIWHLERAIRKRPSYPKNYVRYEADTFAFEMFRVFANDRRSMPSVDYGEVRPLSAHEELHIFALQKERANSRRVRRAKP